MDNFGKIDQAKLESLAMYYGITKDELNKALAERNLQNVTFVSGS